MAKQGKRDFKEIREQLDVEIVLQHYGYTLSSSTNPRSSYRIYKPSTPGAAQRIAVMSKADQLFKGFVDLNDTSFRGDSIEFIYQMEQQDWKRTFYIIDSLLGHTNYQQWKAQLPALVPSTESKYLNNEKIQQTELLQQYQIKVVTSEKQCPYLVRKRHLDPRILLSDPFLGCILQVTSLVSSLPSNSMPTTAFPLITQQGHLVSMDMRGDRYKAFPEGSKGDALWMSNRLIELVEDTYMENKEGKKIVVEKGQKLYFSLVGVRVNEEVFRLNTSHFQYLSPTHLILTESPIDALSFAQLVPAAAEEYRMYVSACGNPSKEQMKHVMQLFQENPFATILLAFDADLAGARYAVNTLGLDPTHGLQLSLHYVEYINDLGDKAQHNRLVMKGAESSIGVISKWKNEFLQQRGIVLIDDACSEHFVFAIEQDLDLLRWIVEVLVEGINSLLGRERFRNALPIGAHKDYNALLQHQFLS